MANHKSALKRARQNKKRNLANKQKRSYLRTLEKKINKLLVESKEEAKKYLSTYVGQVDKARLKGLWHRRKAQRKIGQMSKKLS